MSTAMRDRVVRPTAAVVGLAVALAWVLLTLLDLRAADGAAGIIALFAIPALASAIVFQLIVDKPRGERIPRAPMVLLLLVALPAGILGAFAVAIVREPDYFIGDESPWMLVWIPVFVALALLCGVIVHFFLIFPIALGVRIIRRIRAGEATAANLVLPAVILLVGVVCVVGGLATDTGLSGRAAGWAIIASLFGLPGPYEIVWEPGIWIARGVILAIVAMTAGPALWRRLTGGTVATGATR